MRSCAAWRTGSSNVVLLLNDAPLGSKHPADCGEAPTAFSRALRQSAMVAGEQARRRPFSQLGSQAPAPLK